MIKGSAPYHFFMMHRKVLRLGVGLGLSVSAVSAPLVKTESGWIRGLERRGVHTYLGIPYAAAPVGNSRWRPPARPPFWRGVRSARAFGADCPQMWGPGGQEDCLSLNVWS